MHLQAQVVSIVANRNNFETGEFKLELELEFSLPLEYLRPTGIPIESRKLEKRVNTMRAR